MIDRLLAEAIQGQKRAARIAIALAILGALAGVALLAISGWFLTGAALAGAGGLAAARTFNYLLPSAGIRALAIVRTLSRYGERIYGHKAALFALARLRPALFHRLASSPPPLALQRSGGEVAASLGSDVDALENGVVRQVTMPAALAAGLSGLIATALAGWAAALAFGAILAAMYALGRSGAPVLLGHWRHAHAEALAALKRDYASYAASPEEIAIYGLAGRVSEALAVHSRQIARTRLALVRGEALIGAGQVMLASLGVAAVLALADSGAALAALAALGAAAAADGWAALARIAMDRQQVDEARARLAGLADLPGRTIGAAIQPGSPIVITIDGVTHDLAPGARIRLAGGSGAGKSRLLETLTGLRGDAPERLAIGTAAVPDLGLNRLRAVFAHAPQDARLIAGTVADNLRLARPGVTPEAMWAALHTACLDETVRALPAGLEQWLGDDGARLSGGQRKRLSLARALLAGRPWLLLDEPSEGLDLTVESELADRLDRWLKQTGTGLVLVSHRPGLHRLADQTLMLGGATAPAG